jgi:hypothetical protein
MQVAANPAPIFKKSRRLQRSMILSMFSGLVSFERQSESLEIKAKNMPGN